MRIYAWLVILTGCAVAMTARAAEPALVIADGFTFDQDVAYGQVSSKQRLDILYPSKLKGLHPAVLYIHGGGWGAGDKADDPGMMMDMLNGFAKDGCVALSINYRLSGEAPFPAAVEDCKLAIRWLRANAAKYGVDVDRIGVVGGSAGGHLAAMLAVTRVSDGLEGEGGFAEQSSEVQAAISVSGPTDLQVDMCVSQVESRYEMVSVFLGGPRDERMPLAKQASPITYARKDIPPLLAIHCKGDKSIDSEQSVRLVEALKQAGAPARILLLEGTNHGSDMARTEPVLSDVRAFIRETLKPEPGN